MLREKINKGNIKALAFLLVIALIMSLMPMNVNADVGIITDKDIPVDNTGTEESKYIYFGGGVFTNVPGFTGVESGTTQVNNIKWRVVSKDNNTITLLSNDTVARRIYNPSILENYPGTSYPRFHENWEYSDIKYWLNSENNTNSNTATSGTPTKMTYFITTDRDYSKPGRGFLNQAFTSAEKNAIATYGSSETASSAGGGQTINISQKVVLASYDEVMDSGTWGMTSTERGHTAAWWLRSPSSYYSSAYRVDAKGVINISTVDQSMPVRPVLKLNLNSVLFTSDASGAGTKNAASEGSDLSSVSTPSIGQKLTLIDDTNLKLNSVEITSRNGNDLNISYSGTAGKTLSAVVRNSNDKVTHYGKLVSNTASSGTTTLTLPDGFNAENDTVEVFVETLNDDLETDFASKSITLYIPPSIDISDGTYTAPVASAVTYGKALSDIELSQPNVTIADEEDPIPGSWNWSDKNTDQIIPDVDNTGYNVTFTPEGSGYSGRITTKVAVTVNKATPKVETAPDVGIIYGDMLTDNLLNDANYSVKHAGKDITGSWAWDNSGTKPTTNNTYNATFTPNTEGTQKAENYNPTTTAINVNVAMGEMKVTHAPTADNITYGALLGSSDINGGTVTYNGSSIEGDWDWNYSDAGGKGEDSFYPNASNTNKYSATFKPSDTNLSDITTDVAIVVNKANPVVTIPTNSGLTYGYKMSDVKLGENFTQTGVPGDDLDGSWAIKYNSDNDPYNAGTHDMNIEYTVDSANASNYNSISKTTEVKVDKATPELITTPDAGDIKIGAYIGTSAIGEITEGAVKWLGESVSGTFTWKDKTLYSTKTGTLTGTAIFTPGTEYSGNYNSFEFELIANVVQTLPEIVTLPTATDIKFGQKLSNSTLEGGEVKAGAYTVPGEFEWKEEDKQPDSGVGTFKEEIVFVPDESDHYHPLATEVSITISKGLSKVITKPTVDTIPYGTSWDDISNDKFTGGDVRVDGIDNKVPGIWEFKGSGLSDIPNVGEHTREATFTPNDNEIFTTATTDVAINVEAIAPTKVGDVSLSDITYGDSFDKTTISGVKYNGISGDNDIDGTWSYSKIDGKAIDKDLDKINLTAGAHKVSVKFDPVSDNYSSVTTEDVDLTVKKATPKVTTPTNGGLTYKDEFSSIKFGKFEEEGVLNDDIGGSWEVIYDSQKVPYDAGTHDDMEIKYTVGASHQANYNTVTTKTSITIDPATPDIKTMPNTKVIYVGDTVADSTFTGGVAEYDEEVVTGNFDWKESDKTREANKAGKITATAIFTPDNQGSQKASNYTSKSFEVEITVSAADPVITKAPEGSSIKVGQTLENSNFDDNLGEAKVGNTVISGTFDWKESNTKMTTTGKREFDVIFTPDNTDDYGVGATTKAAVTVEKGESIVTKAPTAGVIEYGKTLGEVETNQFNSGVVNVDGISSDIEGTWKFDNVSFIPSVGTDDKYMATFTSNKIDGKDIYTEVSTNVALTVTPTDLTPKGTASAKTITYGDLLDDTNITGITFAGIYGAEISGSWEYVKLDDSDITDPSDTKPNAGTHELEMKFKPSDNNYKARTVTVELKVNKADTKVTIIPKATSIETGQRLSSSDISKGTAQGINESVPGTFDWDVDSKTKQASKVGTITGTAIFTPNAEYAGNYTTSTVVVTVEVTPASPDIVTAPSGSSIKVGQKLTDSALNFTLGMVKANGENVPGKFVWDEPELIVTKAGVHKYLAKFIPDDTDSVGSGATTLASIDIDKGESKVIKAPAAGVVQYGTKLSEVEDFNGGMVSVAGIGDISGTWRFDSTSDAPPDVGVSTHSATFTPARNSDYTKVTTDVALTVIQSEPGEIIGEPVISDKDGNNLVYGDKISGLTVSGVTYKDREDNELTGKWSYVDSDGKVIDPDMKLDAGDHEITLIFTPDDPNYANIDTPVTITIEQAMPDIITTPQASSINVGQSLSSSKVTGGTVTGKDGNITGTYTWTDESKVKKATKVGEITGTAIFTSDDTNYADKAFELTVKAVDGIALVKSMSLNAKSKTLYPKNKYQLKVILSPTNASKDVTWSSSNTKIAKVDKNGKVTALDKEGTVTITAKAKDGSGVKASCKIKVVRYVTKIRTPMSKYNISRKKTITIPVVCDSGSKKTVKSKLTAKSSNKKIATVKVKGQSVKIKAKRKGKVKITIASANGKKKVLKITVKKKKAGLKSYKVKGLKTKYKKGKTAQIKVTYKRATNLKVTYKSSNKKRATVDKAGKVRFKKKGKVTITVKVGKQVVKKKIRIK